MPSISRIAPCLWFDDQAEAAANYYVSIFDAARIVRVTHYSEAGYEIHGKPARSVMVVAFELAGQPFTALNGGPHFMFTEAISLQVHCDSQDELDYYWERLGAGGDPAARRCGWLKDRFGLSWQIVPTVLPELLTDADHPGAQRTMRAMLDMTKLDIELLQRAYAG